jgi:hypothetical protein
MGNGDLESRIFAQAKQLSARDPSRSEALGYSPVPPAPAAVASTGRAELPAASCAMRVPIGGLA